MPAYVIIADNEVDQIVETKEIAAREKRDLVEMGCAVRIREFASMRDAEEWVDLKNNLTF